jgi:hypothetical protein
VLPMASHAQGLEGKSRQHAFMRISDASCQ